MSNRQAAITYDCAAAIKGIALLLMVFHHCFGFPQWYVETPYYLDYKHIHIFAHSAKICVPVFAFLTGWTYYHHNDKSIKYSVRKILIFLLNYWLIAIPISIFAVTFCGYRYTFSSLGELLPVFSHPLMRHTWYVWFYILMMSVFPLFRLLETRKNMWRNRILFVILLGGIMLLSHRTKELLYLWEWYPSALSGYFIAKFRIFESFRFRICLKPIIFIIAVIFITSAIYIFRYMGVFADQSTGYLSAPLFISGILLLRHINITNPFWSSLQFIGVHSMNIWFIHCIFFSSITRHVVQPIAYFWDNPVWIFCITVGFSLAISMIAQPAQRYLSKKLLPPIFSALHL